MLLDSIIETLRRDQSYLFNELRDKFDPEDVNNKHGIALLQPLM